MLFLFKYEIEPNFAWFLFWLISLFENALFWTPLCLFIAYLDVLYLLDSDFSALLSVIWVVKVLRISRL